MTTLRSLASLLALASVGGSLLAGCGCEAPGNSQRAPVAFTPSSVQASRSPSICGVQDPGFTPSDAFTLTLTGETDVAPPYTTLTLDFTAMVTLNEAVPLTVSQGAATNVTNATSNDGIVQFSYTSGSNASELDANPLASVVVTVTSLPSADTQPLSAELHLTFEDGRALDQVYSAPLQSILVSCK